MKNILFLIFIATSVQAQTVVKSQDPIKASVINSSTLGVGSVQQSVLDNTTFQRLHGNCWRLMDGSSISGTELATLTGWSVLPNLVTQGHFVRQATATNPVGSLQGDAIRNIVGDAHAVANGGHSSGIVFSYKSGAFKGTTSAPFTRDGFTGGYNAGYSASSGLRFDASASGVPTADENRPKNFALNMFVKVSNECVFN